jgi:hypothetical protein
MIEDYSVVFVVFISLSRQVLAFYLKIGHDRSLRHTCINVGFEVLTWVIMKNSTFWNITACSPLKVNRQFGGTFPFHLQGRRTRQAGNQSEAHSKQTSVDFRRTTRRYIPENRTPHISRFTSHGRHIIGHYTYKHCS